MRKLRLIIAAQVIASIFACSHAPDSDKATTAEAEVVSNTTEGETWKVDRSASTVKWIGTKVSGYHSGTIKIADGALRVKDGVLKGGKITLDMKSLDVNGPKGSDPDMNAKLQKHLSSAEFFDTEKYPEATFEITSVKPASTTIVEQNDPRQEEISEYKVTNPTHMVKGNLTIKGITKNIEFPARITLTENEIDAIAKFNIDRSQWNITYPGKPDDLIKNEVHIGLSIKAVK
jgi:polyisoprenoid-binding protein YceI